MMASKEDAGTPEALAALTKAVELEPQNATRARYFLARAKIARGDVQTGLAEWRQLAESLPPEDPAGSVIQADIDRVEKTGSLEVAAEENPQAEMIGQMVTGLAERLRQNPNDADGWARLVRSYAVLGDTEKMNAALAEARRIFKDRPSERAAIEAAVERPQ